VAIARQNLHVPTSRRGGQAKRRRVVRGPRPGRLRLDARHYHAWGPQRRRTASCLCATMRRTVRRLRVYRALSPPPPGAVFRRAGEPRPVQCICECGAKWRDSSFFLSRLVWAAFSCFISMCSFRFASLWLGPSRALFRLCLFPLPFRRGLALCVLHFTLFHVVICSFWLNFDTVMWEQCGRWWKQRGRWRWMCVVDLAVDVCGGFRDCGGKGNERYGEATWSEECDSRCFRLMLLCSESYARTICFFS